MISIEWQYLQDRLIKTMTKIYLAHLVEPNQIRCSIREIRVLNHNLLNQYAPIMRF